MTAAPQLGWDRRNLGQDPTRPLALGSCHVQVCNGADSSRAERDDEHSALTRGGNERRGVDSILAQIENDDVGLERGEVEVDGRNARELFSDQPRVDVIVRQAFDMMIERV